MLLRSASLGWAERPRTPTRRKSARVRVMWSASIVGVAALLGGCTSGATSGSSTSTSSTVAGKTAALSTKCKSPPSQVNVAMVGTLSFASTFYADSLGYLTKAAKKFHAGSAKVTTVGSLSDSDADVASGAAQFEETIASQAISGDYAGGTFRVIAVVAPAVGGVVDAVKGITKVTQLAGKTVAVTDLESNSVIELKKAMKVAGGNPTSIHFVAVSSEPAESTALSQGQVQAVGTGQPFAAQLTHEGIAHVLLDFNTGALSKKVFGGTYTSAAVITSSHLVQTCPGLVKAVQNAYEKADQWILNHKNDATLGLSKLPASYATLKPEWGKIWPDIVKYAKATIDTTTSAFQRVVTVLKSQSVLPNSYKVSASQVVTRSILKKG